VRVKSQRANDNTVPQSAWSDPVCATTPYVLNPAHVPAEAGGHVADLLRPDLVATRVSGPTTLSAGQTGAYEAAIWNDGAATKGFEVVLGFTGALRPYRLVQTPAGFACSEDKANNGYRCTGPLGGENDPEGTRGAVFQFQGSAGAAGPASAFVSLNPSHNPAERDYDNNQKALNVTVK
jgi:hypothetical protein